VTWRLRGSGDKFRLSQLFLDPGKQFAELDRELDRASFGPTWLKIPEIAGCVQAALFFGETQPRLYSLIAYCIMPNHVHAVISPTAPLPRITKSIKGFTARQANQILGRTGERSGRMNPTTTGCEATRDCKR
jgi:putative transposase